MSERKEAEFDANSGLNSDAEFRAQPESAPLSETFFASKNA